MSGPNGAAKPSDNATFSGTDSPVITSGKVQCGSFTVPAGTAWWNPLPVSNLDGVPAASFVSISSTDPRLKQVGTKQQYAMTISLSADHAGVTIAGGLTDAQGNASTPVGPYFVYGPTQKFVCTVNGSGVITPTGRGGCEVTVRWPVAQVNSSFTNATSNPTNFIEARIALIVRT